MAVQRALRGNPGLAEEAVAALDEKHDELQAFVAKLSSSPATASSASSFSAGTPSSSSFSSLALGKDIWQQAPASSAGKSSGSSDRATSALTGVTTTTAEASLDISRLARLRDGVGDGVDEEADVRSRIPPAALLLRKLVLAAKEEVARAGSSSSSSSAGAAGQPPSAKKPRLAVHQGAEVEETATDGQSQAAALRLRTSDLPTVELLDYQTAPKVSRPGGAGTGGDEEDDSESETESEEEREVGTVDTYNARMAKMLFQQQQESAGGSQRPPRSLKEAVRASTWQDAPTPLTVSALPDKLSREVLKQIKASFLSFAE
jgi:hypothetical protein